MWDRVLADCDMALNLDPLYTKALNRRAEALEAMDQLEDALRGPLFVSLSLSLATKNVNRLRCVLTPRKYDSREDRAGC